MHAFVLFYFHKNKNVNYNQILPNSKNIEFFLSFFKIFYHDSPLRLDVSQPMLKSLMLSPFNNTSMEILRVIRATAVNMYYAYRQSFSKNREFVSRSSQNMKTIKTIMMKISQYYFILRIVNIYI